MGDERMLSVLMSVYNEKEEWLRQAVESILVRTISGSLSGSLEQSTRIWVL